MATAPPATPATYGLLGMLAVRPMTGYELTHQVRRSLRFFWATSEGHLYREQKKLVALGWAKATTEPVGRRTRQRYAITRAGRAALRRWLATEPEEPHLQIEGILRAFYADSGSPEALAASMRATAASAQDMLAELHGYVADYLADGGPLSMLEGTTTAREFRGREMFPERLHSVAVALDVITTLLATVQTFFATTADEVESWPGTADPSLIPATRKRLEQIHLRV
ncbi:MAG TPA: PadR family transcriptional regulator [Mycobacteriales bacterium]|nr:PadR family transcriptional regulator [Mycobacteriales bacterium]